MTSPLSLKVTPVITTSIYGAGDSVGGKISIANITNDAADTAFLHTVAVVDESAQKSRLDMIVFDENPDASTFTDNAVLAIHANDIPKIVGTIPIAAADYIDVQAGLAVATVRGVGFQFSLAAGRTFYFALRCGGTPTYAGVDDLKMVLSFVRDENG